jgi:CheY-like chemotaxis protein
MTNESSKYVLIIEDNPNINEALAWIFENEGIRVKTARHGLEALALLKQDPLPTVICLDILMPVMDGQLFRQRQKSDPRIADIPTIIMSASLSKREQLENFENEIFLTKPLNIDKLFEIVKPYFS